MAQKLTKSTIIKVRSMKSGWRTEMKILRCIADKVTDGMQQIAVIIKVFEHEREFDKITRRFVVQ